MSPTHLPATNGVPRVSVPLVAAFDLYVRYYLGRHFHGVRLSRDGVPEVGDEPLVVYLNHPSWWDPLIGLVVARSRLRDRRHFAVIDEAALERYGFFRRLGFFGVEQGTRRGARAFLETSRRVLELERSTLWLTPQGRFSDPRERNSELAPGLTHLGQSLARGWVVPLAIEYPFWEERLPEALARFGTPVRTAELAALPRRAAAALLEDALADAQRRLAGQAIARATDELDVLVGGAAGVGGVYDLWRGLWARARGRRFDPSHGAVVAQSRLRRQEGSRS